MHVPYSMDESEIDLYGGMGGIRENEYYTPDTPDTPDTEPAPVKLFTQEQMTAVLRKHQEHIDQLRLEILDAHSDGYEEGYLIGYDAGHYQAS